MGAAGVTGSQTELFGEKNFTFTEKKKGKNKKGEDCLLGNLILSI